MKNNLEFCFDTLINDLEDMVELDKLTYLPEDSANIEELITWYNQNKDIFVLLKDDKKLIGYSIFFPITKEYLIYMGFSPMDAANQLIQSGTIV